MDKLETLLACLPPSDFKNIFTAEIEQLRQRVAELEKERDKATQYCQIAEGRCDAMKRQRDELLAASCAVVDRWDSPLWKNLPHTGEYIHRLREAIAKIDEVIK